ncbi:hypothetical protein CCUS01_12692 [Colletotrichum cuscutae]|uniref:Uncharacterized protein n=1 Tax=Colletotrichum cuscutae TaxID=1209917 RepID=A0AAI9TTU3_9PEZI|nr:hypothetical protein CCUS01_12692 [Colletotrichum cuscutae]
MLLTLDTGSIFGYLCIVGAVRISMYLKSKTKSIQCKQGEQVSPPNCCFFPQEEARYVLGGEISPHPHQLQGLVAPPYLYPRLFGELGTNLRGSEQQPEPPNLRQRQHDCRITEEEEEEEEGEEDLVVEHGEISSKQGAEEYQLSTLSKVKRTCFWVLSVGRLFLFLTLHIHCSVPRSLGIINIRKVGIPYYQFTDGLERKRYLERGTCWNRHLT